MKKIHITIPDNLTPAKELIAIAKELGKKLLPTKNTNTKSIDNGYEVIDLETQIFIKRQPVKKPIVVRTCHCGLMFDQRIGKKMWMNYGGIDKQHHYCSEECRKIVIQIIGNNRAAIKRSDLTCCRKW